MFTHHMYTYVQFVMQRITCFLSLLHYALRVRSACYTTHHVSVQPDTPIKKRYRRYESIEPVVDLLPTLPDLDTAAADAADVTEEEQQKTANDV